MSGLLGLIGGFKTYIIVGVIAAVVAGSAGFGLAWKLQDGNIASQQVAWDKAEAKAVADALKKERAGRAVTDKVEAKVVAERVRIQTVVQTHIREVPKYVTVQADARCVLPVGFVRLHDAAALGVPVEAVPDPAGRADDAPADVKCSDVAEVVAVNYGAYQTVRAQVVGWQDWARTEAITLNGEPLPTDAPVPTAPPE